jgi:hypothetical protein
VRGDSLRDFYAKTFAVVGLGLLAGAGALIDNWPSSGSVPDAAPLASFQPQTPSASSVAPQPEIVAPRRKPARLVRRAPVAPAPISVVEEPSNVPVIDLTLSVTAAGGGPAPEPLPEPGLGVLHVDSGVPAWLMTPVASLDPAPLMEPAGDWRGFITGAIRKTRASLRDARTGIRDALAGFVGAVRRVSPFFNDTALYR